MTFFVDNWSNNPIPYKGVYKGNVDSGLLLGSSVSDVKQERLDGVVQSSFYLQNDNMEDAPF
jgi:hypothetical protein